MSKKVTLVPFSKLLTAGTNEHSRIIISKVMDPPFNSSIEDWLFNNREYQYQTLYMWRNRPLVVIGRHQNAYKECFLSI